jgi:Zn-dependent peptidase ImmA (M78 family)
MIEFSDLYNEIQKQGIYVFQYNVGEHKSVTIEMNKKYGIFIDMTAFSSLRESKRAIAHEIGHCATGATHKTCSPLDLVEQHEYRANKWAVERFLSFDELQQAMQDGYTEPWELAEYFDVSEKAVRWAVQYYTENRGMSFNKAS